jgi:hypothetical protein
MDNVHNHTMIVTGQNHIKTLRRLGIACVVFLCSALASSQAVVALSTSGLSFGGTLVGTNSSPQSITLTNTGTATLNINSIVPSGDFSETDTCQPSVAPSGMCSINVTFTPTAVWSRGGTIVITDNAKNGPQQVVPLVGMGNSGAQATLSSQSLSFANQQVGTSSPVQNVTLTNTGAAVLNINSIVSSGDYSQTNTCGPSLAVEASCTISVTFTPSYASSRPGFITVNDSDPSFLQTVTLSGRGTAPISTVAVSPRAVSITSTQTEQFSASISGIPSQNVNWSVDGVPGGNAIVGTISISGLYAPPGTAGAHIVKAISIANPAQNASAQLIVTNYPGTFTYKNDNLRTGQNLNEIVLTTGNVNPTQFGKLFSYPVDGHVYAQPLYVAGVNIPGQGVHNVVYVATENDSVFAFDADNIIQQPLWQRSFIDPVNGITTVPQQDVELGNDLPVQVGITATPVIDPAINTIFVLARTKEVSNGVTNYVHRLHALDMTTGAERPGSPMVVQATVSGTGSGGNGKTVSFNPLRENPRSGLLLVNGTVYLCWASLEDIQPYHGWLIGYIETNLQQQVSVFNTTPNGREGGIWQGGGGAAADADGAIFVTTGNGTFDANTGGVDYGDSVLKLTGAGGALSVADYFSPFNQASLSITNQDLSAGGIVLLPDQAGVFPHLALVAGKGSAMYEINRDNLGQFSQTANQIVLTVPTALGPANLGTSGNRAGGPAYWQDQVYFVSSSGPPRQFSLLNGLISSLPIAQWSGPFGYPGASPVVSANGNTNAIVWALQVSQWSTGGPAILRAFDAANISRQLYSTALKGSRDTPGPAVKFTVPTVANGKVYIGTQTELDVYGLLP